VIATLGRYEELQGSGQLERLLRSGARFAAKAMMLSAVADDAALKIAVRRSGPTLGYSKDHRPDLKQMILAVLLDGDGRPVCSEMWPGNTADVTSLIPVVDRLRRRFDIGRVCVVAHRGMISAETLAELEARRLLYILGVRERTDKLVRELVLDDPAPFVPLAMKKRGKEADYEAKAVMLASRLYIVCRNHAEAEKDAASLWFLARDQRRSGFIDRNRDRAGRQALHRPRRAASRRQPRPARNRRRAAADRARDCRRLTVTPRNVVPSRPRGADCYKMSQCFRSLV
jgi:hypothetical protein